MSLELGGSLRNGAELQCCARSARRAEALSTSQSSSAAQSPKTKLLLVSIGHRGKRVSAFVSVQESRVIGRSLFDKIIRDRGLDIQVGSTYYY